MRSRAFVVASLALAGCGIDRLTARAASDLQCPAKQVRVIEVEESRLRADGCGKTATYFCTQDTQGREICEREVPTAAAEAQKQAERDTRCPAHQIEVASASGGFDTSGCGRKGHYTCTTRGQGFTCEREKTGIVDDGEKPKAR